MWGQVPSGSEVELCITLVRPLRNSLQSWAVVVGSHCVKATGATLGIEELDVALLRKTCCR